MYNNRLSSSQRYDYALSIVLAHEGGLTENPKDPGGITNFGITQKDLDECHKRLKLPSSVIDLIKSDASIFYKSEYWDKYKYDSIESLHIATKIFDMAVNLGATEAHKIAQRCTETCGKKITVDGIIGPQTINDINEICFNGYEEDLMYDLQDEQKWFYQHLVEEKPELKPFLKGWLVRAAF